MEKPSVEIPEQPATPAMNLQVERFMRDFQTRMLELEARNAFLEARFAAIEAGAASGGGSGIDGGAAGHPPPTMTDDEIEVDNYVLDGSTGRRTDKSLEFVTGEDSVLRLWGWADGETREYKIKCAGETEQADSGTWDDPAADGEIGFLARVKRKDGNGATLKYFKVVAPCSDDSPSDSDSSNPCPTGTIAEFGGMRIYNKVLQYATVQKKFVMNEITGLCTLVADGDPVWEDLVNFKDCEE